MASLDDILTAQKNGVVAINQVATNTLVVQGRKNALNVTADTLVYSGSAWVARVVVMTGVAGGYIHDANSAANAVTANRFYAIPATAGVYDVYFPVVNGIVIKPAAGSVVALSYS